MAGVDSKHYISYYIGIYRTRVEVYVVNICPLQLEKLMADEQEQYDAIDIKALFREEFSETYLKLMRDKYCEDIDEIMWMAFVRGYTIRGRVDD